MAPGALHLDQVGALPWIQAIVRLTRLPQQIADFRRDHALVNDARQSRHGLCPGRPAAGRHHRGLVPEQDRLGMLQVTDVAKTTLENLVGAHVPVSRISGGAQSITARNSDSTDVDALAPRRVSFVWQDTSPGASSPIVLPFTTARSRKIDKGRIHTEAVCD